MINQAITYINTVIGSFKESGHELLYLSQYGSHLYGTDTNKSDLDFKGVFLPSKKSCLLGNIVKTFDYNTKSSNEDKNSNEDVDVQLWSLQYFLKLLGQGDTNAIDLLYSYSYPSMVVFEKNNNFFKYIYGNHHKLFSAFNVKSYVGYAIHQAHKYGIKGSRLGIIKKILEVLCDKNFIYSEEDKLGKHIDTILNQCGDDSYCFVKTVDAKPKPKETLFVVGSQHHFDISIFEFIGRMQTEYAKYGERARLAEINEGIDYKALSHAMRAIRQMEMILTNGEIVYPLYCADELKRIKSGSMDWKIIEELIVNGLDNIKKLQSDNDKMFHNLDSCFVDNLILNSYE